MFWITAVLMLTLLLGAAAPTGVATTGVATTYASQASTIVGETGRVTLNNTIDNGFVATVNTTNSYTDPVVVAFITSRNSSQSVDVRVRNVTGSSFQIFMEEPDGGNHVAETAAYIVMEKGRHVLDGGLVVEAGTLTTASLHVGGNAYGGDAVTFAAPFANPPAVLHTLNTYTSRDFMSSAVHDVTTTGFQAQQEAAETGSTQLGEAIGWIALATGTGTTNGATYEVGMANDGSGDGVDNTPHIIIFNVLFATTPDIVAKMIVLDSSGGNGAWARSTGQFTNNVLMVYAEEDQVGDAERNHGDEHFAWAAFAPNTALVAANCLVEATGDNVVDFVSLDATAVQQAINAATAGDTLKISGNCAGVNSQGGENQTVYIDKDLTLVGGHNPTDWSAPPDPVAFPTVLDAEENGRVVYIPAGSSVTLDKLTLINGSVTGAGAGIWTRSDLTLSNSRVLSNTATDGGGGINSREANLTVKNSVIQNNSGQWGGGIRLDSVTSHIENSLVDNNTATGSGGGIAITNGVSTIIDSTISNNEAPQGDGIDNQRTSTLHISNSTISQNGGHGIVNVAFAGTTATVVLIHTTVVNNGGTNIRSYAETASVAQIALTSSIIAGATGNDCRQNGAGSTMIDATAGYNLDSDGTCVTAGVDNNITTAALGLGPLQDNGGETPTHALLPDSPAIDRIPLGSNGCGTTIATDQRGVTRPFSWLCDSGAYEESNSAPACFVDADGDDSTDYASVSAIAVQVAVDNASSGDTLRLAGSCLGVYSRNDEIQTVYIDKDLTLIGGHDATDWSAPPDPVAFPTVLDAEENGRVVYIPAGFTVTLDKLTFINGSVTGAGAGIYTHSDLILTNSKVLNNMATTGGGGIHTLSADFTVKDSLIQNNSGRWGGGIRLDDGTARIENSLIDSNMASAGGGGIAALSEIYTITDSTISNNEAVQGDGIENQSNSTLHISNSTVSQNGGQGILNNATEESTATVVLAHTTVVNNGGVNIRNRAETAASVAQLSLTSSIVAGATGNDCHQHGTGTTMIDATAGYNLDSDGSCVTDGVDNNITTAAPGLGPLQNNGGETPTHALLSGSPAIDRVPTGVNDCGTTITSDQRGSPRDLECDSGAYEGSSSAPACFVDADGDDSTDYASVSAIAVQVAVDSASSGDTLRVAGSCLGVYSRYDETQTVYIDKDLTLIGGHDATDWSAPPDPVAFPTVLDAEENGRVVYIPASFTVTLDKLMLINGSVTGAGAGIWTRSDLTLTNSKILNNISTTGGGGIHTLNTHLTVKDSVIQNNRGQWGGGIRLSSATADIENSLVDNNTATDGGGGLATTKGVYTITDSTISNNEAPQGDGIDNQRNSTLHISNSTVSQNGGHGIVNGAFAGNTATVVLTYTTVVNNGAANIFNYAEIEGVAQLSLTNSIIADATGNDCRQSGAGSTTIDATAGYNLDSDGTCVTDGVDNNITTATLGLGPLQDNGGETPTHALLSGSPALDQVPAGVNGCGTTITSDQRGSPRDLECDSGAYEGTSSAPSCFVDADGDDSTDYASVSAIAVQVAVDNASSGDTLRLAGSCLGVYIRDDKMQTVYIDKDLTLIGGHDATDWSAPPDPVAFPTVMDAEENGRVVYIPAGSTVTLDRLTLINGSVTGAGGGIHARSDLTLTDSKVLNNMATTNGGGIHSLGASLTVKDSLIQNNSGRWGGGIRLNDGTADIENSLIDNNMASAGGGGIYTTSGIYTITDSTISNNEAPQGDGIENQSNSTLHISNSTISQNGGHGIFNGAFGGNTATVVLTHTTVANNSGTNLRSYAETAGVAQLSLTSSIVAGATGNDCLQNGTGIITIDATAGYNLDSDGTCVTDGVDNNITTAVPGLGPLQDNGGETPTHALLSGSPALDQVPAGVNGCGTTLTADQRGEARPANGACDIGAFEGAVETAVAPTLTINSSQLTHSNDNPSCTYDLYQSSSPYSGFALSQGDIGTTPVDISGDVGSAPDYYYVAVDCGSGGTAVSNTVGEFSFAIVPGS